MDLVSVLIQNLVGVIVLPPLLWISGRILAETGKAKFTDAVWIVFIGVVIGAIVGAFLGGLIAGIRLRLQHSRSWRVPTSQNMEAIARPETKFEGQIRDQTLFRLST